MDKSVNNNDIFKSIKESMGLKEGTKWSRA